MDNRDNMPPVDWARYVMDGGPGGPAKAPVGDPTRWGAELNTLLPASGIQTTNQILAVRTNDSYSRSWSLFGTLTLPIELWQTGGGVDISLEVSMGVGQAVLNQRIALFAGSSAGGATTTITALCEAQYLFNGGVYEAIVEGAFAGPNTIQTRAFAAVGALVGQSINIRARYIIAGAFVSLPSTSRLALIVAPYAAGGKL